MNREQLNAEHPDLVQAIFKDGHAAGHAEGVKTGTTAERARVADVLAAGRRAGAAHADLTATAIAEGQTAGDFALAILAAEEQQRAAARADLAAKAPKPAKEVPPPPAEGALDRNALHSAALAYQREHGCDYITAAKAVGVK